MFDKKYKIIFTEPTLGTCPGNKDIMTDFIASKNPAGVNHEEIDAIPDVAESLQKATTFFARDEKGPFLWDYQVKGFFKGAILAQINAGNLKDQKKLGLTKWTYKRTIDQLLFVFPRRIYYKSDAKPYFIERPLRAETMQGERIALAKSEALPAGTEIEFTISVLREDLLDIVEVCMDYGKLSGISQWRNSGAGRFEIVNES